MNNYEDRPATELEIGDVIVGYTGGGRLHQIAGPFHVGEIEIGDTDTVVVRHAPPSDRAEQRFTAGQTVRILPRNPAEQRTRPEELKCPNH